MRTLAIARRFCGPPDSANGGYFAGRVASLSQETLAVRLLAPPPLDTDLRVEEGPDGALSVRCDDAVVAQARPERLVLPTPPAPRHRDAVEASARYAGFQRHPFPTCFVCGPRRAASDGLRIFPGALGDGALVAAPWVPDASLDGGDGRVRPEFIWAALDCPGWFAVAPDERTGVLGELSAQVERGVRVDEACTVVGWRIASSGRKHESGTALFDAQGEPCARARAVWIEKRG